MKIGIVYWIKIPLHADIRTEGYVGVTTNMKKRWREHINKVNNKSHSNQYLSNVFSKHSDIYYEIIFQGPLEGCYQIEEYYRHNINIGWNLRRGGEHSSGMAGKKHSEESRKRMCASQNLRHASPEAQQKMLERREKSTIRKAAYQKIRNANKIKLPRKPLSTEHKAKISAALKGKKKKQNGIRKTRVISDATRAKLSISNAKSANIYEYKTHKLIATGVCIKQWAKLNGYCGVNLSSTARADHTLPSTTKNRHHTKNIYAKYII